MITPGMTFLPGPAHKRIYFRAALEHPSAAARPEPVAEWVLAALSAVCACLHGRQVSRRVSSALRFGEPV